MRLPAFSDDRWTLLITRELMLLPCRYGDLQAGLPGIPTNGAEVGSPGTIGATLPPNLPEFPYEAFPVAIAGLIFTGYVLNRRRRLNPGHLALRPPHRRR